LFIGLRQSRSRCREATAAAFALALLCAGTASPALAQVGAQVGAPAAAQDATDKRVQELIAQERDTYGPPPLPSTDAPRQGCDDSKTAEIVVCGRERVRNQRIPSTAESDPNSREAQHALNSGGARTPWVSNLPDCSVERCTRIGKAPPPIYIIDMKAIAEPPADSDADKIARGEMRAP
jgi:hypothetical protein